MRTCTAVQLQVVVCMAAAAAAAAGTSRGVAAAATGSRRTRAVKKVECATLSECVLRAVDSCCGRSSSSNNSYNT